MSEQLISILMPAYNCDKFVKQAIDSMLNQSYLNFELLIADDCSTDRTKEIIDSYTDIRIKRFHNDINLGYLKASNKLFKQCKGNFITFQDADDYSDKDRLRKLKQFLDENPEIACVGSNVIRVDEFENEISKTNFPTAHKDIIEQFKSYKNVFTGAALMIRREIIEKVGIYDLYFDRIGSEDIYWYSNIIEHYKVSNLSLPLYFYRTNPNSITRNHRNPKAEVMHGLVLFLFHRRELKKKDFIKTNELKKADAACVFLQIIELATTNKLRASIKFTLQSIMYPSISILFLKVFLFKMFRNKNLR